MAEIEHTAENDAACPVCQRPADDHKPIDSVCDFAPRQVRLLNHLLAGAYEQGARGIYGDDFPEDWPNPYRPIPPEGDQP